MFYKLLLLSIAAHTALCAKIIEYKFGTNFGQIFYDYSGNNRHAVNGNSSLTLDYDTKPTDRGAFFAKDIENRIKLPPNDVATSNFYLGSKFSVVLWIMTGNSCNITIFCRLSLNSNYVLKIKRLLNTNAIWLRYKQNSDFPSAIFGQNDSFLSGKWQLIVCTLDGLNIRVYMNGVSQIEYTMIYEYSEDIIDFFAYLGYNDNVSPSIEGYLWYFSIFDLIVSQTDYYGGSYNPGNCLVSACPASCDPSILQNNQQYCISINFDSTMNGEGSLCSSSSYGCSNSSYGCSGTLCLNCECNHKSCEIVNNQVNCLCSSTTVSSQTTCTCPNGYYFLFPDCLTCYKECATCNQANICLKCIADNSTPKVDQGCECNSGYYGSVLIEKTSCNICYNECATCNQANICLKCIADNSTPKVDQGCECNSGYYGSVLIEKTSCNLCYKECATCSQASICLKCIADNSTPKVDQGCECNSGYYGSVLIEKTSCNLCYKECATCSQASICLKCIADNSTPRTDQGCECNSGYYGSLLIEKTSCNLCYKECTACSQEFICLTCISTNASPSENGGCLCNEGYYGTNLIYENSCISCHIDCQICNDPILCTKCKDLNAVPSLIEGCNCVDGYYMNENTRKCIECYKDCKICNSSSTILSLSLCLECKNINSNLIDYNCSCPEKSYEYYNECICSDGYYMEKISGIFNCSACQPPCLTCFSLTQCNSCRDENLHVDDNYNCVPSCKEGYYISGIECKKCSNLCKICSSESSCQECFNNADNYEYQCFCKKGYFEENRNCIKKYFSAVMLVSKNNKVGLLFSEETEYSFSSYSINISLSPAYNFSYKQFEINSTFFYLIFNFNSNIPKDTKVIIDLSSNSIYSKSGKTLEKYIYNSSLYEYAIDENSTEIKNIKSAVSSSSKAIIAISIGCGIISNPSSSWQLLNTIQLISYISLGSNPLTTKLKTFLSSFGQYNIVPNAGYYIFSPNSSTEPYLEARRFGFKSSTFLLNTGQIFTSCFTILIMWFFIFIISRLPYFKNARKIKNLLSNYKYSFFIRFWIQSCLEIGICAIIQIRSDILIPQDGHFNLFSAVLCLIIFAILPAVFFICSFINQEEILNKSQDLMKKWGSFYVEFKINKGFWSSQYYLIYFTRRLIYIICEIYLNQILYLQAGLQIFCSVFSLSFLFYYRPFKDLSILISAIISEICVLIVFMLTYFFLFDLSKSVYNLIENLIIGIVLASVFMQFLVCLFNAFKSFYKAWKKIELVRAKSFLKNAEKTINQIAKTLK
ncbi:hypothetical protein SteCoe_17901 [Stentor coeruleus]|uniref:EGF-like domain-containing protein n=1 Tax=Stentor coeruleus TaxID=5963 RepID=A0A1R2BXR5_9CILI|nr:hypothetical protein SteCoe_17901 [Stentor coeruleus]